MKYTFFVGIFILFTLMFSGCTPTTPSAPSSKTAVSTPTSTPAASPSAPAEAPAAGTSTLKKRPTAPGLSGTIWKLDDYVIEFKGDTQALVRGGPISAMSPEGLTATYSLKETVVELAIPSMSFKKTGIFDGTKLEIGGRPALRQP